MTERLYGGPWGAFTGAVEDLESRGEPDPNVHQQLVRLIDGLPEAVVRDGLVRIIEAINPGIDCACSDLSQVTESQAKVCGYHSSRIGWIVHLTRLTMPQVQQLPEQT